MSTLPSIISYIPGIVFNLHFVSLHMFIILIFGGYIMNIFDSAEDKKNLKNLIFQFFEGRNNVD